jgi:cytochrome b561
MESYQRAQRVLGWFVLLGAVLQFFLAGLAVFRAKPHDSDKLFHSSAFDAHRVLGDVVILVSFALLVLAILNHEQVRIAAALFALMILQFLLADAGSSVAVLGALHPINGIAILGLAHLLARGPAVTHPEPPLDRDKQPTEPAPPEPVQS